MIGAYISQLVCRACFNMQWCTKCAVMTWNVQWWKAIYVVMIVCPIVEMWLDKKKFIINLGVND